MTTPEHDHTPTARRSPRVTRQPATAGPHKLSDADARRQMEHYGVPRESIEHDFVISHFLAAIAPLRDQFVFYGGTALSRTILDGLRLSEDIDLLSIGPRPAAAQALDGAIRTRLARTFGRITAEPSLTTAKRDTDPCIYRIGNTALRIQLIDGRNYIPLPRCTTLVHQHYHGLPDIELTTLTPEGFVVAKTMAWSDTTRNAPRDLYYLWALATAGHITADAARTYRRIGPTCGYPKPWNLPTGAPSPDEWFASLNHQCQPQVTPQEAHDVTLAAWHHAVTVAEQSPLQTEH
ncbi:MAG TPA: nucleotidyl transferase AbiEii/AbiGii toxin family protein [Candidatus Luteococcus avicola]|nr:nucleotidyl transferase AbiEii/AbiGii toxin family protein [Candidatus Luteococcus avicola]